MKHLCLLAILSACASAPTEPAPADVFLEDLLKTPAERCEEAKAIVAGMTGTADEMRQARLLAIGACVR